MLMMLHSEDDDDNNSHEGNDGDDVNDGNDDNDGGDAPSRCGCGFVQGAIRDVSMQQCIGLLVVRSGAMERWLFLERKILCARKKSSEHHPTHQIRWVISH